MKQYKSYRKKKRIVGKAFLLLFAALLVFVGVCAIRWAIHKQEPAEGYGEYVWSEDMAFSLDTFKGENLYIDENAETLKVMQLADPQLKFSWHHRDKRTMDLLGRALDEEKPDIVVCTGDLVFSVFTYDTYKYFAEFMEERGQYWTLTYGNHDAQFDCSKYTLYKLLENYPHCLFSPGPSNVKGESNFLVNVYKGKNATVPSYSLIMLDSGEYPEDGESNGIADWVYDWFGDDQVAFYTWAVNGLTAVNPDVHTSVFFHIPTKDTADFYYASELALDGGLPCDGTVCEADKKPTELMDEGYDVGIFYQGKDVGFFDAVVATGKTDGVFYGHDHANTFRGEYEDVYLCYGHSCGFHTYPFFEKPNFITRLAGLDGGALFNGQKWVDKDGNVEERGFTVISVDLRAGHVGDLTVRDVRDSDLK